MNRKDLSGKKIARVATMSFVHSAHFNKQIRDIKSAGAEITLISAVDDGMEIIDSLNVDHFRINFARDISLFRDLYCLIKLYLYFKKNDFDIIHSVTPKAGLLSTIAGFLAGVPLRIHTFSGQAWANLSGFKRWICILMDRVIIFFASHVFADGQSQIDFLLENKVLNEKQEIRVLGHGSLAGVDLEKFEMPSALEKKKYREQYDISKDSFVFIFLGRVNKDKGIYELIASFNQICMEDENSILLIVGPLDMATSEFESLIADNDRIRYFGYTPDPEIFVAVSDILCIPSHREGFCNVILNAGAMGVASIGSDVIGVRDPIIHLETGILFKKGSITEIKNAMKLMIQNKDLRNTLSKNAMSNVNNHFSSELISNLWIEEYKNLTSET